MKVTIVGAGEVGFHIADRLAKEGHQITIVDQNPDRERYVGEKLDARIVHGNGASSFTLQKAGITSADLFIAVTDIDEVNLVACLVAKEFKVPFKIARVKNTEYVDEDSLISPDHLGIDLLINPQHVVANDICKVVAYSEASEVAEFGNGKVVFISFVIGKNANIIEKSLKELRQENSETEFIVAAITRKQNTVIPTGDDVIRRGDTVSFVCKSVDLEKIHNLLGLKLKEAKTVFLLGGGGIGLEVAKKLSDGKHKIRIIEKDPDHCRKISEQLDKALILCGDSKDADLLKEEGIQNADAYIAVTNDDSANILGSLLAKRYGVKRAVAIVNDPELFHLAPNLGVDACISPRLASAGAILKYIRGDRVMDIAMLEQNDAEVIEFEISATFKDVGKLIKKMHVPKGVIIGAIRRGEEAIIPSGEDSLQIGDHVIVFCLANTISKAEKYFS